MSADAYLPHTVRDVPVGWLIGQDGAVYPGVAQYVAQGVVRIIAGPERAHCIIHVKRPYYRPRKQLQIAPEGQQ